MSGAEPSAADALLELRDVHTYYGDSHILHGVSLTVSRGEVVALLGRNGVGKTTTIQTILGLPSPRNGEIRLRGEPISTLMTYEIVLRRRREPGPGRCHAPTIWSRACTHAATLVAAHCPAASSRCSRSHGRWCRTPRRFATRHSWRDMRFCAISWPGIRHSRWNSCR